MCVKADSVTHRQSPSISCLADYELKALADTCHSIDMLVVGKACHRGENGFETVILLRV